MAAGAYYVKVHVSTLGYAAHPSNPIDAFMVTSLLSFTSVSPRSGSLMGGVTITISGHGFAADNVANDVMIDGQHAHILNSTHTRIVAVTPIQRNTSGQGVIVIAVRTDRVNDTTYGQVTPHARRYSSGVNHTSVVAETLASHYTTLNSAIYNETTSTWVTPGELYTSSLLCSTPADCLFSYNGSLTPTVASVSPLSGSMGTSLTISGTGFTMQPNASAGVPAIDVLVGNANCTITSVSDTSVQCTLGATPAGTIIINDYNAALLYDILACGGSRSWDACMCVCACVCVCVCCNITSLYV